MPRTLRQYKKLNRISLFAALFRVSLSFLTSVFASLVSVPASFFTTIFTSIFVPISILTVFIVSTAIPFDSAFAADNRKTVYHGRIVKPDGTALSGAVAFTLQITDTSGACVLWEETQNATVSSGVFSLTLGSGTNVFDGSGNSGTLFASPVFNQGTAINCKGGTPAASVTPGANDDRNLNVTFNDGSGVQTLSQQIPIKSVPYSLYAASAANADKMAGYAISTTAPATGQVLTFNGTSWAPANAAATGVTSVTSANSDVSVATSTTTPVLTLNSGTGANQIVKLNGSSQLPAVDGSQLTSLNASQLASGYVSIARGGTGLSTSGAANQVLGMNNAASGMEYKTITAGTGITVTHGVGSVTIAATNAGTVTSVTGALPITIGGTAQAPVVGISAATTSASGAVQLAQSTDTAANLVVQANDTRLTNARTPVGTTLTSGNLWVGNASNQATAVSMSGDATISNAGALTLATTSVTAGTYGNTTTIPTFTVDSKGRLTAAASAAIPTANGSTTGLLSSTDWTTFNNKGTVASVTSANSDISVSASTTAPVLTLNSGTGANQIVKLNGSSQLPAVDGSQLTSLNASNLASGYVSIARGGTSASTSAAALTNLGAVAKAGDTMTGHLTFSAAKGSIYTDNSSSGTVTLIGPNSAITSNFTLRLPAADGSANQVLKTDGAGNLGWVTDGGGTVTSVTASSPISVTNGTSTPNITISQSTSTTNGYLSSTDWSTFNNKQSTTLATDKIWIGNASNVATAVSVSKDVSVTYNAGTTSADYTVKGIRGIAVSATTPTTSGQVLRYDSVSTSWIPNFISMADLRSTVTGASALTSCSASQTLTWSSATDNLACSNISISAATQLTGVLPIANGGTNASTSAAARTNLGAVNIAGDTMTGALNLPANGLTVGTSQLVASGGNVGIGTTTPTSSLYVARTIGNGAPYEMLTLDAGTYDRYMAGNAITMGFKGNSGSYFGAVGGFGIGSNTGLGIWAGIGAGSPNLFVASGGNVGIGITAPATPLHVQGPTLAGADSNRNMMVISDRYNNGANGGDLAITSLTNAGSFAGWNLSSDWAGRLSFGVTTGAVYGTTPNEYLTIISGGNVGIGTTNPSTKLDIVGATTGTTMTAALKVSNSLTMNAGGNTSGEGFYNQLNIDPAGFVNTANISIASDNRVYVNGTGTMDDVSGVSAVIGSASGSATINNLTAFSAIPQKAAGTVVGNYRGLWLRDATGTATNTYGIYQDGSTVKNYFAGNVGIGTTSPGVPLRVLGTPTVQGGTMDGTYNSYAAFGNVLLGNGATAGNAIISPIGSGQDLLFATFVGGVPYDRLHILNNGSVGIGTTSPGYTLHVVGTAGLSTGTAWTNASDIRLKDIQGDYQYGLDEVLQLHTVRYNYKKDNALGLPSDFTKTGFIAQEVQRVIPEAVNTRKDGYLELNVDPIHWAVVNAVKEMYHRFMDQFATQARDIASVKAQADAKADKAEVDAKTAKLEAENAQLKQENAEIKARLDKIEKALNLK